MREILFRGIGKISEEWENGYLVIDEISHTIITIDEGWNFLEVIPETVVQYTGLEDKNGNKIFEGDIVKVQVFDDNINWTWEEEIKSIYDYEVMYRIYCADIIETTGNIHEGVKDDYK